MDKKEISPDELYALEKKVQYASLLSQLDRLKSNHSVRSGLEQFEEEQSKVAINYGDSNLNVVDVKIKKLPNFVALPEYKSEQAAGMDLYAAEDVTLFNFHTVMIATGVAIALPEGFEAQVRTRSGLATKGVMVTNSPGTIDSDYRGEIKVILTFINPNGENESFKIKKGDRIAQMVISPVYLAKLNVVEELDETERGEGGFGSTGQ